MQSPFKIVVPFLLLASAMAVARDLPAELVKTDDDFFLKGQPKKVRMQAPGWVIERKFDRDGIMISQMVGGFTTYAAFETEVKKGRLVEIRFSPSKRSDAPASKPLQFDREGRVTAIRDVNFGTAGQTPPGPPPSRENFPANSIPTHVRIIRYEGSRQVHDIYANRSRILSLAYEFSATDRLTQVSCVAGDCSHFTEYRYNEDGPTALISDLIDVSYIYENGVLMEEITLSKHSKEKTHIYYGDYTFDACGNWTQQASFDKPISDALRQRIAVTQREIEYYSPCIGSKRSPDGEKRNPE